MHLKVSQQNSALKTINFVPIVGVREPEKSPTHPINKLKETGACTRQKISIDHDVPSSLYLNCNISTLMSTMFRIENIYAYLLAVASQ